MRCTSPTNQRSRLDDIVGTYEHAKVKDVNDGSSPLLIILKRRI